MAKLEIKTRLAIKMRKKDYYHKCCYCKHWYRGPRVERDEGVEVRKCLEVNEKVEGSLCCICECYDGDWVSIPTTNQEIIRDSESPLQIKKRRRQKHGDTSLPPFTVKRRWIY